MIILARVYAKYIVLLLLTYHLTEGCQDLFVASDVLGGLSFKQIPIDDKEYGNRIGDGRPSYFASLSDDSLIYLYHTIHEPTTTPRWVINDEYGNTETAIAYINSWSILPNLIKNVNDNDANMVWFVSKIDEQNSEHYWEIDDSLDVLCYDDDKNKAIFFESSLEQPYLSGYYIERLLSEESPYKSKVYSFIRTHPSESQKYLYKIDGNIWMIGNVYGIDDGYAMVHSTADSPQFIINEEWLFSPANDSESGWVYDYASIYHVNTPTEITRSYSTIYDIVRYMRSVKTMPPGQKHVTLRNDVPMPVLGLGTGGIYRENLPDVLFNAFDVGYRLLDLAREYDNEDIVPVILERVRNGENMPTRYDMFLQTKVWPTELGYIPTYDSIYRSLEALKTSYIDSYMLHWPECNREIDWMHCDDIVDPDGTWRESYRVLERAYSEGLINAIGVSNFDINLLNELKEFAIVLPHIVQNFAEIGNLDDDVREWCDQYQVIYQPYASLRNKNNLPDNIKQSISEMSKYYEISEHNVILRFFYQTGSISLIPRSTDRIHLLDNMRVFHTYLKNQDMEKLGWTKGIRSAEL